jgi:hypothetical protein
VIGEANDGLGGRRDAERLKPDVAVLDIDMPGIDGIEAIPRTPQAHQPREFRQLQHFYSYLFLVDGVPWNDPEEDGRVSSEWGRECSVRLVSRYPGVAIRPAAPLPIAPRAPRDLEAGRTGDVIRGSVDLMRVGFADRGRPAFERRPLLLCPRQLTTVGLCSPVAFPRGGAGRTPQAARPLGR